MQNLHVTVPLPNATIWLSVDQMMSVCDIGIQQLKSYTVNIRTTSISNHHISDNRESKYSIRWFQELIGEMKCPMGINIWLYSDFANKSLPQSFFFCKQIIRLQDKYLTCQRKPTNQTRVTVSQIVNKFIMLIDKTETNSKSNWRTVNAPTRGLFWCSFPELRHNSWNLNSIPFPTWRSCDSRINTWHAKGSIVITQKYPCHK